ncbi:hypothetical protein KDN34_03075 [Shewanella yunxiaonensis]|uniref:Uncharacterized protein n=1 Tax=Shewanella yunxiaonensis TaxID=2829809 RepID=A0ABX7YUY8_9GAMM|nr:hypothetical protein [Shewanella yunxiaonensis]QUN06460.1 hypothetical protein KDN34_03075 [Shewanella yunxiaonensis]
MSEVGMSFEAKVKCDGFNCGREKELNSQDPSSSEIEYYALGDAGWLIDENGFDYCPKCAPIVKAEREEQLGEQS